MSRSNISRCLVYNIFDNIIVNFLQKCVCINMEINTNFTKGCLKFTFLELHIVPTY